MKKFTKKLLAVMLSVLMVCTVLPFSPMTAMADAQSDLEEKCAEYEQFVVDFGNADLGTNGYGALKTNMYPAYQAYIAALEALEDGTESEMATARTNLTDAMAAMADFTPITANAAVKIGDGETQPTSDDYAQVIYSDGETNANWNNATKFAIGGSYSLVFTTGQFWRTACIYFPNTVVLNDGSGQDAMIPIVAGFRVPVSGEASTNGAKEFIMENLYENTQKVYLRDYWTGTNDGYYNTSYQYPYTSPQWPHLNIPSNANYFVYQIANRGGISPNPYKYQDSAYQKYWLNNSKNNQYAMFKNVLCYKDTTTPNSGLTTVNSIRWLGAACINYEAYIGEAYGQRAAIPLDSDKSKIYAINYNILLDALKDFISAHKTTDRKAYFTADNAKNNTLGSIFRALDRATGFNPSDTTKYNYAANIATAAQAAGDEIDAAIDDLDKATLDGVAMGYEGLLEAIAAYEDKMSHGEMFTNMADAYKAYLSAVDYRDAYLYGERRDFDPSLQEIAHNLDVATRAMVELNEAFAYEDYSEQAFDGDADNEEKTAAYYGTYQNLLYVSNGPDRVRSDNTTVTNPKILDMTANGLVTYLYVPDAVAVYDGYNEGADNYTVPVLLGVGAPGNGGIGESLKYVYAYRIDENNTGLHFNYDYWLARAYKYDENDPNGYGDEDYYVDINGHHYKYYFNIDVPLGDSKSDNEKLIKYMMNARNGVTGYDLPTQTYIETASLNQILNLPTISEEQYCFNAKTDNLIETDDISYVSNPRSDHGANIDDVENFYANVLTFDNPFDETDTFNKSENFTQFYHHYSSIHGYMNSSGTKTNKTNSNLGLYVINFKPVVDLIVNSSELVRDPDFLINNYQEGNLLGYFEDFDKLTSVSPSNKVKYQYDNAGYTDRVPTGTSGRIANLTGHDAAVQQNAYDMYQLFASNDEDVKLNYIVDENGQFDADYIAKCKDPNGKIMDTKTVEGGEYEELAMAVTMTPEIAGVGTCQDGVYWRRYDAAFAAGKQAMRNIADKTTDGKTAHKGYIEQEISFSYKDDDGNTITETANSIAELAAMINEDLEYLASAEVPRTRHEAKFKERKGNTLNTEDYDVAIFECANDTTHDELYPKSQSHENNNEADISVYNALDVALSTIDYERYTNDNIIKNAEKNDFDTVMTEKGAPGEEPQTMVDEGISAMLTAINTANSGEYDVTYTVTLNKQVGDDGSPVTVESKEVVYGNVVNESITGGTVYKWLATYTDENGNEQNIVHLVDESIGDNTNQFELKVQSDITLTAYVLPEKAENKTLVRVLNPYNKVGYAYLLDNTTAISANEVSEEGKYSAETVTLGGVTVNADDKDITLTTYTNLSFKLGNASVNGKTLSEVEKEGVYTLALNAQRSGSEYCEITYNGKKEAHKTETSAIVLSSEAGSDFVAIAVKNGDKYIPISYNKTISFYSNSDLELADITYDGVNYYAGPSNNKVQIAGDDYFYYAVKRALPFVYTGISLNGVYTAGAKNSYTVHSMYANMATTVNAGVEERGTVICRSNLSADEFVIGTEGVLKYNAPKASDIQFANSMNIKGDFFARGYVKYKYSFVNEKTNQTETIEAIVYSDAVSSAAAHN